MEIIIKQKQKYIDLNSDDIAKALDLYLHIKNINIKGARTILINDVICSNYNAKILIDLSAQVIIGE